jgi:hypothetical protein
MVDFAADSALAIRELANCTVAITLEGVVVADGIPGIFNEAAEVVSPYDSERAITKPAVTVATGDFAGITSQHVLKIREVEYKFDGKPRADIDGMTVVYLGVKK